MRSPAAKQTASKLRSYKRETSSSHTAPRVRNPDGSGPGALRRQQASQAGPPPSEGLPGVQRQPPKQFTHMAVGWRPQVLTTDSAPGLCERPHTRQLASPSVSDPRERDRKRGKERQTEGERTMPSPSHDRVLELTHCHTITFYSLEARHYVQSHSRGREIDPFCEEGCQGLGRHILNPLRLSVPYDLTMAEMSSEYSEGGQNTAVPRQLFSGAASSGSPRAESRKRQV